MSVLESYLYSLPSHLAKWAPIKLINIDLFPPVLTFIRFSRTIKDNFFKSLLPLLPKMHFKTIQAFCFISTLLAGGMASPIAEVVPKSPVENSLDTRANCPTQSNQCSTGTPYCCSPNESGGNDCVSSDTECNQQVICCNNSEGVSNQERLSCVLRTLMLIDLTLKSFKCVLAALTLICL